MKNTMKKLLAMLLALMLLLALAACGSSADSPDTPDSPSDPGTQQTTPATDDEVYYVTVELNYPEPAAGILTQYFRDLEDLSDGRLQFDIYYGYSLNGEAGILDALEAGIIQVAGFMPYTEDTLFPYSGALFNMPFLGFTDMKAATDIWYQMLESSPEMQTEYENAGLTVIAASANPIYDLHFKNADLDVHTPADLKGLSIITTVPEIQTIVNNNGGAPIESSPGDYYSNLDKGVADGIIQHINILTSFGVNPELCGQHVRFEKAGGGFVTSIINVVWSTEHLNSLPQDLQDIIKTRSDTLSSEMVSNDMGLVENNYKISEEAGAKMVYLTEAEGQAWRDAAAPIVEESLARYEQEGADQMTAMYQRLKETIASYSK